MVSNLLLTDTVANSVETQAISLIIEGSVNWYTHIPKRAGKWPLISCLGIYHKSTQLCVKYCVEKEIYCGFVYIEQKIGGEMKS